ncbi:MAG: hypothetical protein ACE5HD_04295 [Acidobacteriota bacterium]
MHKKKGRIAALIAAGAAVSLLVGGLVVGSNMGFKINLPLAPGQIQWISVPYTGSWTNARELVDILTNKTVSSTNPDSTNLQRTLPTSPVSFEFWQFNQTGAVNFSIQEGEGFAVKPQLGDPTSAIVAGAHDPFQSIPAAGPFVANLLYLISIPYHTTAVNANDILQDLPGQTGTIFRLNPGSTPSFDFWQQPTVTGGLNFPVVLGEAYEVKPQNNGTALLSHF